MAWIDTNWQQDDDINHGFPYPVGASAPIAFDTILVYTPWQFSSLYNDGFPYIVFMPSWKWPSDAYMAAIAASSRSTCIRGTITTPDGDTSTFDDEDLMTGSLSLSADMTQRDTLSPGAVPAAELRLSLADRLSSYLVHGAEIALSVFVMVNGYPYEIPMGYFTICELENADGFRTLECYDRMKRLDNIRFADMAVESGKAYTVYEIIKMCADAAKLDVDLNEQSALKYINGDKKYVLSDLQNSAIETARDLLMYITQTICAFARINRYGVLEIVPIMPPVAERQSITHRQRMRSTFTYPEYRLLAVETKVTMPETDKIAQITDMSLYADGVTVSLLENPLWTVSGQSTTDIRYSIRAIRKQLELCRFHPCEAEIFGDPSISLFDWITYTGRTAGDGITSPVTSYVWRYHGTQTLTSCGRDAVAGVVKSQAEKAAAASRMQMQGTVDNVMRSVYLKLMQQSHGAMGTFTHAILSHYTHAELGGGNES